MELNIVFGALTCSSAIPGACCARPRASRFALAITISRLRHSWPRLVKKVRRLWQRLVPHWCLRYMDDNQWQQNLCWKDIIIYLIWFNYFYNKLENKPCKMSWFRVYQKHPAYYPQYAPYYWYMSYFSSPVASIYYSLKYLLQLQDRYI